MRRRERLRLALCIGSFACCLAVSALALDEGPSLLLVGAGEALGSRIGAELEAQGFRVVRTEPTATGLSTEQDTSATEVALLERARREHASAVVRVSANTVEIWYLEPATAGAPRELLRADLPAPDDAARVVAARVVELLRGRALDLAPPPSSARSVPAEPAPHEFEPHPAPFHAAAAPPPAPARRPSGALHLDADIGMSAASSALAAAPLIGASVFWQPVPLVAFGLAATVPLSAPELSSTEGSARIQSWSLAAGPRVYPFGADSALEPFIGVGLGVLWFHIEGTRASSTFELATEQLVIAGPHAALGVRWHLFDRLALTSRLEGTYAAAKPVVEFAGRPVATLGRPFVLATLGIEFRAAGPGSRD